MPRNKLIIFIELATFKGCSEFMMPQVPSNIWSYHCPFSLLGRPIGLEVIITKSNTEPCPLWYDFLIFSVWHTPPQLDRTSSEHDSHTFSSSVSMIQPLWTHDSQCCPSMNLTKPRSEDGEEEDSLSQPPDYQLHSDSHLMFPPHMCSFSASCLYSHSCSLSLQLRLFSHWWQVWHHTPVCKSRTLCQT